jgi:predicted phage gp36 major capsid-like protein
MKKTETKSRVGEGVSDASSPVGEVKAAMAGFMSDLKGFQDEMKSKLNKQEERLTMLDRKSLMTGRPALATTAGVEAPHQKAFENYVRSGDDDALRGLELEGKAM